MNWRQKGLPGGTPQTLFASRNGASRVGRGGGGGGGSGGRRPDKTNPVITLKDGEQLRYCPGERCRMYLPLFQFSGNANMPDGRDTYCTECNHSMRREKRERRWRYRERLPHVDKFYAYKQSRKSTCETAGVVTREDVERRLEGVIQLGRDHYPTATIPFTPAKVYAKLFTGRRLLCEVTNEALTPACFMDHHGVRVVVEEGRACVRCSQCRIPANE
jgi:hypothetical protein